MIKCGSSVVVIRSSGRASQNVGGRKAALFRSIEPLASSRYRPEGPHIPGSDHAVASRKKHRVEWSRPPSLPAPIPLPTEARTEPPARRPVSPIKGRGATAEVAARLPGVSLQLTLLKNQNRSRNQDGCIKQRIERPRNQEMPRNAIAVRCAANHIKETEIGKEVIKKSGDRRHQSAVRFAAEPSDIRQQIADDENAECQDGGKRQRGDAGKEQSNSDNESQFKEDEIDGFK